MNEKEKQFAQRTVDVIEERLLNRKELSHSDLVLILQSVKYRLNELIMSKM